MSELPYKESEFSDAWDKWLKFRKEIKKPYKSPQSEKLQLNWFIKQNYSVQLAIAAIEQSIRIGWQGIFPPKELVYGQKTNQWSNKPSNNNGGTSGNRIEGLKSW